VVSTLEKKEVELPAQEVSRDSAATGQVREDSLNHRVRKYISKQLGILHFKLGIAQALVRCIPYGLFGNLRSIIYRWAGFKMISSKVHISGALRLDGVGNIYRKLHIEEHTFINTPCSIDLNAPVHIGRRVGIGHHVVLITTNHEIGPSESRMTSDLRTGPITIEDGAWIGACVTILPGVTVGRGAVVAAGAVVTKDVPPNAKVAGNRAEIIGWLDDDGGKVAP
jgi:maltose O-acetyltransferase